MKTITQINNELLKLLPLIEAEQKAEVDEYTQKINDTPLAEQRKLGICRYPLKITEQLFNRGEHLMVKLTCNYIPENTSDGGGFFKSGRCIKLFAKDGDPDEYATGVINNCDKDTIVATLNNDSMQDWMLENSLCVQPVFDNTSYKEMTKAVKHFAESEDEKINHLKTIFYGDTLAEFDFNKDFSQDSKLNDSQNQALKLIDAAQDVAVVHGPPGTGKTTTLVRAIIMLLKNCKRILVCTPGNSAADLITEQLAKNFINVVRIGQPARIDEQVLNNTLDYKIAAHPNYKDIKQLRRRADNCRRLASKFKRNFGPQERAQRNQLYNEARSLTEEADNLAFYITNDIITKAEVITSTLVGSSYREINDLKFDAIFIDEAAQALEPACLIPIFKAEKIIFAGDYLQLPPTVKSREAIKGGLQHTLFEKIMNRKDLSVMLTVQYRMNAKIMQFSNLEFYDGKLTAHDSCKDVTLFDGDSPLQFVDTAGTGFSEKTEPKTFSTYNEEEAALTINFLKQYLQTTELNSAAHLINGIGIISPYKAQTSILSKYLNDSDIPNYAKAITTIDTADGFQGRERDIIIISMTRSNDKGEIGFLNDIRRMNVAMTRAKKKLVIIGDSATISHSKFYNNLVEHISTHGEYSSAFEFLEY